MPHDFKKDVSQHQWLFSREPYWRVLGLLLWSDAVERIDILTMEIRHLQTNVSYGLRDADLLRALRYEEPYIWGAAEDGRRCDPSTKDWLALFRHPDVTPEILVDLAALWVLPLSRDTDQLGRNLPGTKNIAEILANITDGGIRFNLSLRNSIIESLSQRADGSWYSGQWNPDDRRDYDTFDALQRIKRNLVHDKLHLCWWGAWAFDLHHKNPSADSLLRKERLAQFLVVRAAVMRKVYNSVERVGDLQKHYEKHLDLGREDHHRPLATRRRLQGAYSAFLSSRATALRGEMDALLDWLGLGNPHRSRRSKPVLVHRWRHQYSSEFQLFQDSIARSWSVDSPPAHAVEVISSSYWMPDRPDLQSGIAHEAAHIAACRRLDVRRSVELGRAEGEFARLLRELAYCLQCFEVADPGPETPYHRAAFTLNEVAADLLGAAVQGPAYLFAVLQDLLGHGLGDLFELPNRQIDLTLASWLWRQHHVVEPLHTEWFCRLMLLCVWIDEITPVARRSSLHGVLLGGVEQLANLLLDYLYVRLQEQDRVWPRYWRAVTERMCTIVRGHPGAARIRGWLERESAVQLPESDRATMPLSGCVRTFLKEALVSAKRGASGRALNARLRTYPTRDDQVSNDVALRLFGKLYLNEESGKGRAEFLRDLKIFETLHDIPWETALLRSVDYLDNLREHSWAAGVGHPTAQPDTEEWRSDKVDWTVADPLAHASRRGGRPLLKSL